MGNKLVSIIIPTLNSEKFLEKTVLSLLKQSYKNIEIIICDSGSTDNTLKIAEFYKLKIVKSARGRSLQKNNGAEAAEGEYLYFVDDDFNVDKNVVSEAVTLIEKGSRMVEVHNTSDPQASFWSRVRKFERDMYVNDSEGVAPRFFPREVFWSVKGFNEHLIAAEDYDIYNRLRAGGLKLSHTKSWETHLNEPKSLREIISKHFFYGRTVNKTGKEKAVLSFQQKIPFKLAYLKHWTRFIIHPVLTAGLIIYQGTRFASGFAGLIYARIVPVKQDTTFRG